VGRGVIIIVARDRLDLYDYLREAFAGIESVRVIMDRRLALSEPTELDDPLSDASGRRSEPDVYDDLLLRGFIVKRVPCLTP
jgi:hypothetical protein